MNKLAVGERFNWLDEHLEQMQSEPYVPEKGDVADVHLAHYINEAGIDLDITRVSPGLYQIGTEQVGLKVVNENLAVRIGGGYTNAQEFLERFKQKAQGTKSKLRDAELRSTTSGLAPPKRQSEEVTGQHSRNSFASAGSRRSVTGQTREETPQLAVKHQLSAATRPTPPKP